MTRELYWLVILEAASFFCFPAWELASVLFPLQNPRQFAVDLLVASVIATLVFHVGPAFFLHRLDRFAVPAMGVKAVRFLLGLYCLEWLGRSIVDLKWSFGFWLQVPAFLVAIVILAQDSWRRLAAASLGLSLMLLTALLWINWPGIWTTITTFTFTDSADRLQQSLFFAVFLSSASVIVVAGRIGRLSRHPSDIWKSGLWGVTIPLMLSLTMASFAAGAGAKLYYKPSLPLGFEWAWGSITQKDVAVVLVCVGTGWVSPIVVSCWSLRALFRPAPLWKAWGFGVAVLLISILSVAPLSHPFGERFGFASPFQLLATRILFVACTLAGLAALLKRPRDPHAPSPAGSPDEPPSP